jgi:hypothetical protein
VNAERTPIGVERLSEAQLLHGTAPADPAAIELRVGPVTAQLHGVELAYVRVGDREVVRRIYASVREENWDTVLPSVDRLEIEERTDRAVVTFGARNESGAIAYSWDGRIEISADGSLRYDIDGRAERSFRYCRLGFCVLHDAESHAGRPYRAGAPGLPSSTGVLPEQIAPQLFREGVYLPVVPAYTHFEVDLDDDLTVCLDFEGELFELEDQRNWTDASFKTYCTPAAKRYPFEARPGQRFSQSVALSLRGTPTAHRRAAHRDIEVDVGAPLARELPPIGTSLAGSAAALSEGERQTLRKLAPSHLRVEVHLGDGDAAAATLAAAASAASAVGVPLELALYGSPESAATLSSLLSALRGEGVGVARVLAFDEVLEVTPASLVEAVRLALRNAGVAAPVGGGTDIWFAEIHRDPPDAAALDVLSFSLTPEVHAFDDISLVETLAVQAQVVSAAAALAPGIPVAVSPVTLRPRNSAVTIDSRQRSLFCAAWTVGAIRYLIDGGAAAVTFYEATGARGIMETDAGSAAQGDYPALAGAVFPVYHVLAHACSLAGARWCPISSSDPARVDAFAAATAGSTHMALANMRAETEHVRVLDPAGGRATVRVLDSVSAPRAMAAPSAFAAEGRACERDAGSIELELAPHAVAFLEIASEPGR